MRPRPKKKSRKERLGEARRLAFDAPVDADFVDLDKGWAEYVELLYQGAGRRSRGDPRRLRRTR